MGEQRLEEVTPVQVGGEYLEQEWSLGEEHDCERCGPHDGRVGYEVDLEDFSWRVYMSSGCFFSLQETNFAGLAGFFASLKRYPGFNYKIEREMRRAVMEAESKRQNMA